eukprot:7854017-Prorocentrum_lima.AAC.1
MDRHLRFAVPFAEHKEMYKRYVSLIEVVQQHRVRLAEQQAQIKARQQELYELRKITGAIPGKPRHHARGIPPLRPAKAPPTS